MQCCLYIQSLNELQIPVVNNTWHYEQQLVCLHIALYPWQLVVNMQFVLTYLQIYLHAWLLKTLMTAVNESKTKIWPNPLPGWSTFDHIPDHIFLIIHFVCRHFCGPDFTIPISRRNPFSFQKLSPFTYHCFCSNIYMLNFHKMNSYQGNDHLSREFQYRVNLQTLTYLGNQTYTLFFQHWQELKVNSACLCAIIICHIPTYIKQMTLNTVNAPKSDRSI